MDAASFLILAEKQGYSVESRTLFQKAITLAEPLLLKKKRLSGYTYFDHNLRVAAILIENKADPEAITVALVYTALSKDEVNLQFNLSLGTLLDTLNSIKEIKIKNSKLGGDALRKIILTTIHDIRVIIIKLANKLDNLSTVAVFPEDEQKRIASEVLEIYAPLAYRLGLEKLRVKLEDAAFKILNPRKYQEIQDFLEESREQREKNIEEAITKIKLLAANKINLIKIKGRPKHIYSIYKKMTDRGVKLNEQYDLLGIRVIVADEKECYALLGLLHEKLEPVEGRLKDYIANPKPNFYRSIHTAILLPNGKIAEVQIRTTEMDEFAEEGLAAHWQYKGLKSDQVFEKKMAWLKSILELQKTDENKDFLETVKVDLFGDTMYCYTPKGDPKELPKGSTLLDFAYAVHEEIGNHAVGGKVNGRFVPLKEVLTPGDVVEIVTNKNQQPRRSWIKIVTSPKSQQKIRRSLKAQGSFSSFHFRTLKSIVTEEQCVLVHADQFPKAQCELAKCCHAIPGDALSGIITKRRIISVHRRDCRQALKEEERWIPVEWRETFNQRIRFFVEAEERSGLLADVLHTIATAGFEVKEAKAKLISNNLVECSFVVIPRSLNHLTELIQRVQKVRSYKLIYFE